MSNQNPYEPAECRTCGQPVRVEQVTDQRASGPYQRLLRRCDNPDCRTNNMTARASDGI